MKMKNGLLVLVILLTGCANVTVSATQKSDSGVANTSENENSSNSQTSFDNTPYVFEAETISLPAFDDIGAKDWIGTSYDCTGVRRLYPSSESIRVDNIFNNEWRYNIIKGEGAITYASKDHKPVLEFDSRLIGDVNEDLTTKYRLLNTNADIQLGSYKDYIYRRTDLGTRPNKSFAYHARANALYYTESFPSITTFKEECTQNLRTTFLKHVKDACEANTKEAYAKFFKDNGTHVIYSCAYGMGSEILYEASSDDYNLKELVTAELKNRLDEAVLAGVNSKTVGEYEEKKYFDLINYSEALKGKYIYDSICDSSLYGGKADIPPMTFNRLADVVKSLMTTKVEDVKQSSFLTPKEVYPIWTFLPSSMKEEETLLRQAFDQYVTDREQYFADQLKA